MYSVPTCIKFHLHRTFGNLKSSLSRHVPLLGFGTFSLLLSESTSDVMKSLSRTRLTVICTCHYSLSSSKWYFVLKVFRFVCVLSCTLKFIYLRPQIPAPKLLNVFYDLWYWWYTRNVIEWVIDLLMKLTSTTTMMMMIRMIASIVANSLGTTCLVVCLYACEYCA